MSSLDCPKCSKPMSTWCPADVELDHCSRCKGLWFDANELSRHLSNIDSRRLAEQVKDGAKTTLPCPRCPEAKLLGGFLLDIPVESCPECEGIFLDAGEIYELLGALNRPDRMADGKSSLSGFDNFALGLFVGMRRGVRR
jgi:Zn-finger nucleic acid-binding protein